ncbi:hypothetical protein BH18ACI2_BH18ACI2_10520 [soil metagenome]
MQPGIEGEPGVISFAPPVKRLLEASQSQIIVPAEAEAISDEIAGLPPQPTPFPTPVPDIGAPEQRKPSPLMYAGIAAMVAVLLFGGVGLYLFTSSDSTPESPPVITQNGKPAANVKPPAGPAVPKNMVLIPAGKFEMGRNNVEGGSLNEYPAHTVELNSFYIDKTEVTNEEYGVFVHATNHRVPKNEESDDREEPYWKPWKDGKPPAEQGQWPVRNVSVADAEAFAKWRSERVGRKCSLPTEEQWEYAARGMKSANLYPWGPQWIEGRANINAKLPVPVNSFSEGANNAGVLNLIGNVWEWTSSKAKLYDDNDKAEFDKQDRGKNVRRGGSYLSVARGDEAITATSRTFSPGTLIYPTIGFRLLCEAP